MRQALKRAPEALQPLLSGAAGSRLAACGSRAGSLRSRVLLAAAAGPVRSTPAAAQGYLCSRSWASTAAADGDAPADATAAPCERGPLAQAANELDRQLAAAAQSRGAAAVLQIVEEQGEHFTELNVISALAALHSGGGGGLSGEELRTSRPFQTLVDMLLAGLQRFEPTLLAQAVHHCGRLGASEEMLLDEVGRHLMRHIDALSPADVAALVGGLAALDHSPSSVLFDALSGRAEELRGQFSQEQRQVVADGFHALGYAAKTPRLE